MRRDEGQSLIEVLVALAVMVIVILALVRVTTTSIRNATFARNRSLATKYAQDWMEEARKSRDEDPDDFFKANSCDSFDNDPTGEGIFDRDRDCTLDSDTMTVIVIVEWTEGSKTHQSRLETNLTKWK